MNTLSTKCLRLPGVILSLLFLAGCSTPIVWKNQQLEPTQTIRYDGRAQLFDASRAPDLLVVASFSGGGSRAAAFASAVVAELNEDSMCWQGRPTTLARELDMVIGVSGGSIAATHLALHGVDGHLARFEKEFIAVDFQSRLLKSALSPAGLLRQTSATFGRGQVLAGELDTQLFGGKTFGDLARSPSHPYLIVGATDLATGADFDITSEQMSLLCSSIDDMPLSFAVAASSSVPLLFSPLTLRNHSRSCPVAAATLSSARAGDLPRTRLAKAESQAVVQARREYLHLVDGGLSDNLGTRRIVDYVEQAGGVLALLKNLRQGTASAGPLTIVFITVNSERLAPHPIDEKGDVPSVVEVIDAMVFGGFGRYSRETALVFSDAVGQWQAALNAHAKASGRTADRLHAIDIGLSQLSDPALRDDVLNIPTSFRIEPEQAARLRIAAAKALQESVAYQDFRAAHLRTRGQGCGQTASSPH